MKTKHLAASILATLGASNAVLADHSWNDYHWARTTSSFDLTIINSTTTDWDGYVSQAISDWSQSNKLNMIEDVNGDTSSRTRRKCNAPDGMVRICNLEYGQNGWLGIAGISLDNQGHIITGYTKMNDTYFNMAYYSGDDWKQSVTCQELGHDIGLGHQDEDFDNESLFSCMDYQDPPYEYPNRHDYDQLGIMYGHTDSYNSYSNDGGDGGDGGGNGCNAPPGKGCNKGESNSGQSIGWGRSVYKRGNAEVFMRIDPDGTRHLTHVTWAIGHENDHGGHDGHQH
jgi:hypothetical protein